MEFLMDMVHHNPGEEPFKTEFLKPEKLKAYGYNTKVCKHYNTIVRFDKLNCDFFPTEDAKKWLNEMTARIEDEIYSAKDSGIMIMTHLDLFVLPKLLVEKYKDELCDENGKISVFREKTKEIHRILFDELFGRYPIDGIVIRVGETYLHDTPYHTGNGGVLYGNKEEEKRAFTELINFLREEVCVKHGKYVIFRTWDCFPDRFHADKDYYLDVTNKIEPHEKLIFSIKHTALDFWRNVKFNPCLTEGKHRQVIEVQSQREYEGKGSYPMYVMDGIINGFKENKEVKGIKDIIDSPLICGLYEWSRGGGWKGPYIKNEFWCDLNSYVICQYMINPQKGEKGIFKEYAENIMGLKAEDAEKFHKMCVRVQDAVLHGRYISPYDKSLNESFMPCANWIRDDKLGGLRQLNEVFDYLEANNLVEEAIDEKELCVSIWEEIKEMFKNINVPDENLKEFISGSIEYGLRFYRIVSVGFRICAECRKGKGVRRLLDNYDRLWSDYRELEGKKQMATLYHDVYMTYEGALGMNETIDYCRKNLNF